MRAILCGLSVMALAVAAAAQADDKMIAYGRHLSQECTTCHKPDGGNRIIPPLVGLEVAYFMQTMNFYKDGARNNPVMVSVAKSLDADQLKALAIYFASLPAPATTKPIEPKKR